jgi:hypothetical protein
MTKTQVEVITSVQRRRRTAGAIRSGLTSPQPQAEIGSEG